MSAYSKTRSLWRNLFHSRRVERDLDTELQGYCEMLAGEKSAAGMDAAEARRAAAIEMGGIEQVKEQVREVRMGFSWDTLIRDIRFATRMLARQPAFTMTVTALLAIGIAGTSAIFSLFSGLYLRPLPFEDPEQLVYLNEKAPQWNLERTGIAYPDFHAWRQGNSSFEGMAAFWENRFQISDENGAETVQGARATHDLMQVLRIQPQLGRWFTPQEDRPNGPKVAVIGHAFWLARFGGAQDVIGKTIRLNSEPYEIAGVLPPGVDFPNRAELWIPLARDASDDGGWYLGGVGRLKPQAAQAKAGEDLLRIHKALIGTRDMNKITSPTVQPLREWYVGNFRQATHILLGAVALVLAIACANIAGIMLARGATRTREMGIRSALGAPRWRIVRQLVTESLLLGALGGILGTILGSWGLQGLLSLMPSQQLPNWVRFDADWRFVLFSLTASVGSAVLFGLWPAWKTSRADIRSDLQDGGARQSDSGGQRRTLEWLITAEVALSAVLLTSAGLLIQAFRKVENVDPGFRATNILTYQIALPNAKYGKPEQRRAFVDELLARHRALPGAEIAAATSATPLGGHWGNFFEVENAPPKRSGDPSPVTLQRIVTAGYLEAMGMTLRSGRTFTDADGRGGGPVVVVVNEAFARLSWSDQAALGKRIRYNGGKNQPWMEVVGVIADVKDYGLDQPSRPSVYLPFAANSIGSLSVVIRTSVEPASLANPARQILRQMDSDVAVTRLTTMAERLQQSIWMRRAYSWLVALFACLAVVLVLSGLYGVISYIVTRRRREIAIRMALGAGQTSIVNSVLAAALKMTGAGLLIGVACGWWSSRLFQSLLFGVEATDPATYVSALVIVGGVALLASLVPAIRAARMEPLRTLRLD